MAEKKNVIKKITPKKEEENKPLKTKSKKSLPSFNFQNDKIEKISGFFLILLSVYFTISFFSYLFTWHLDQDKVDGASFFSFVFTSQEYEIQNILGKLGAITSHRFIYNGFGIASFIFPFLFFIIGIKLITKYSLVPLIRTFKISFFGTVWTSLFFGYFFFTNYQFLGGSFGYFCNQWLNEAVGKIGSFFFLIFMFFLAITILFNPEYKWIKQLVSRDESKNENNEPAKQIINSIKDINIINNIKDEEINEDEISETVVFDEEEEDEENDEEDIDDSEITFETKTVNSQLNQDDDFEVEVADVKEEILSDSEINQKVKDFGEYDPTLDLSSYRLPTPDLLNDYGSNAISIDKNELEENKNKIVDTLKNYKIDIDKIKATVGPTVTLYEIIPAPGVRISKIKNLEDDIALSLAALGIRIIAPIPGKGTIGIEVPNSNPDVVASKNLLSSDKFQNSDMELPIALGKTISNETFIADLAKMPHLLMAGATGQGKSVGLNQILVSILYKKHPSQVKFVLVDPKKVELTLFNKIERHFLAKLPDTEEAIITDTSKVVNTVNSLCIEMDNRYELLKNAHVRNIKEYNAKFIARRLNPENGHRYLPYIVLVVDEFADLIMTAGKEIETPIARLAQLARAIGIHLIIATQRPSVNIITGTIKANFPCRIAFRVTSKIDSRTILDTGGADQLIGRGDMLFSDGNNLVRVQCGFVDTPEVERICDFIGEQRGYPEALLLPEFVGEESEMSDNEDLLSDRDALFNEAAHIIVLHQQGSASLLQRKLKLGYNRAGRLIDQLEAAGIVGPFEGSKARKVLYTDENSLEQFLNTLNQ